MSPQHVVIGFGDNYNRNFGQASRIRLPHRPLDEPKEDTEGQHADDEDDSDSSAVPMIDAYQFEDAPWMQDKDDDLVQVATSSASSLFLSKSGKVFSCGMMHGNSLPKLTQMVIQLPLKCIEIAAGRHFCLARMEGGLAICSWGAGHFGQLALGGESPPYNRHPTVVEGLLPHVVGAPIAKIVAGHWHAMAVTEAGDLYTWGCNRSAQCGFKPGRDPPMVSMPHAVRFEGVSAPPKIVKIAAGRGHSVALDDQGKIYAFGSCSQGQCGVYTRRRGGMTAPKQVDSLSQVQIVDIAAGGTHTLALTGGGRVFAFGSGYEGQLGTGMILQMNPKPKLVGDLDFVAIEAGREWKTQQQRRHESPSIGVKTEDGGKQEEASSSSLENTELSQAPKIVAIHAAGNSSLAISSSGHLYAWGCNDSASLGLPKLEPEQLEFAEPSLAPNKSTLRQFHTRSFDSSHNIGLPQRVDCLRHIDIVSAVSSGTFMWCLGKPRQDIRLDASTSVGRTLYEHQEAKRQISLRPHHRTRSQKKNNLEQANEKAGMTASPIASKSQSHASPAAKAKASIKSPHSKASTEASPSSPEKSPSSLKGKRRFSLHKTIGKIVRRASKGGNNGRENGQGDDEQK